MKPKFLLLFFVFVGFEQVPHTDGAEAIRYEQLKGDSLKEVLKPIPPKEPAEALRSLRSSMDFLSSSSHMNRWFSIRSRQRLMRMV